MVTDVNDLSDEGKATAKSCATASSLLQLVRLHDKEGWHRLTKLYSPFVYSWCRRKGLQSADAADVVQEVFQAVFLGIAAFRRDRPGDSFRRWLRTIRNNKIRDFWRRGTQKACATGGTAAQLQLAQLPTNDDSCPPAENNDQETHQVFRRALEMVRAEFEVRTGARFGTRRSREDARMMSRLIWT